MADKNEYISEAYDTLMKLSADELKRLEYEAREKGIRDYNAGMKYAQKRGLELGISQGLEQGLTQGEEKRNRDLIYKWTDKNVPVSEIADRLEWTEEEVRKVQAERT